ncbi:MAG: hybrid sensor histidine kinase/response regulator [Nostocales cyanobacterium 94392]|nr:hybrid sensor histidine kinase/response regulator [Nostocales cyanobacterium 94392]
MKKASVLIIDDEPDNFDVIETLLSVGASQASSPENHDYQLHYAANGQEAIASLDIFKPDIILLDVMMPGIDGIEVCGRIKAMPRWQSVPIIMVTALNSKEDLANCLKSGADDFISKPVNGVELRARVNSMLRIKHQYDDLQTLLKLREDMVNMVVHDLRNPLTDILLGVEILKSGNYPTDNYQYKLSRIYSSAQALQVLIDDLLTMALLESGKVSPNYKEVYICELIQSVISNFEAIAAKKNQLLVSQLPEESSRKVLIDATMMHRTLDNLLSNAIKFSPHDSQIIFKVEFLTSGHCKIQVIDSGPGVADALQQKIFEKYEIGKSMSNVSQIGLGLAFCKMVVEAHGGEICVKNNQPQGAIFEIILATR